VAYAMLPPARWKRGRATRCEPAGRALWCAGFHRWGSGLARWGTRDELVREEKRYRFSEARMNPPPLTPTTVTHPGEGLRYREGLGRHRTRFLVVPVAVPVGSSRAVENRPTQAKNVPAGSIGNY